ncbi:hypothetical protein G7046_g2812 [Stylonectria norvegica]|nr:hypothetical protein G7046_g2812 [Stylonectria norvegica]
MFVNALILAALATSGVNAASAWASSGDGSLAFSSVDAPVLNGGNSANLDTWDLTIKEKTGKKQTVNGFGAAVTDSTVTAFNALPAAARTKLLRELMTSDGVNFNLLRHTIASSDLSGDPAYTYADNGGKADPSLSSFNLGDRGTAMAKMLAEMRGLQSQLTILGSPWAPPGWMQLDGVLTGTTTNNNLNHDYVDAYSQYFVKYLKAYESAGAHIDAITIQNEPLNSRAQMPTMYIFADESGALIRDHVGPAIVNAGLKTKVWAYDHNTDRYDYAETVVNTAPAYVNAAAWHCYAGNDPANWAPLTKFHNEFPNTQQYMTECWTAKGITDWKHTSNFALMPLQNWANGIIAWGLGTYTNGGPALSGGDACTQCTGLVTIDQNAGTYKKEVDYYMIGQFSRYIPKGAVVVDGTGSWLYDDGTGVESVSTINPDGTRTVVVQNRYTHDMFVRVKTESEGSTWNSKVPASSVTTWVLPKA